MESLPVELWRQILSDAEHADLLAIAATCRFVYNITKPQLYNRIYLEIKSPIFITNGGLYFNKTVGLLMRSFQRNPELRSLVRTLHVCCADIRDVAGNLPHWRNPILCDLPRFSGLQNLYLRCICIDAMLLQTLTTMPTLTSIEFEACEIDPSLQAVFGIRAKKITISWPRTTHGWAAVIPSDLQTLAICLVHPPITVLFADLLSRRQDNALTTLDISECVPANLVPFLMKCPQLRAIILPDTARTDEDVFLPEDALPLLEKFSGAYKYSLTFIPARPLYTVSLTVDSFSPLDALKILRLSSAPITALTVDFSDPYNLAAFLGDAPVTLKALEVQMDFDDDLHWVSGLEHLLALQTLCVCGYRESLTRAEQEAVVQEVGKTCRSVREVAFEWPEYNMSEWTWRWQTEGRWECYVD